MASQDVTIRVFEGDKMARANSGVNMSLHVDTRYLVYFMYLFSGSDPVALTSIFASPKMALYRFAIPLV